MHLLQLHLHSGEGAHIFWHSMPGYKRQTGPKNKTTELIDLAQHYCVAGKINS
jgi:hypothetical protein